MPALTNLKRLFLQPIDKSLPFFSEFKAIDNFPHPFQDVLNYSLRNTGLVTSREHLAHRVHNISDAFTDQIDVVYL